MKKIVLASSNAGKMKEIKLFFNDFPFEWLPQSTLGISDAEEIHSTFVENALLKARHASALSGLPALADDSGLVVDALDGAPGVYSARYAGTNATDADRIQKLVNALKNVSHQDRSARFYCVMAFLLHPEDPTPLICEGSWEGHILEEPQGEQGFGYDPIFYVPEYQCSAASLDPLEKNRLSHRGQALKKLARMLTSRTK
jgi:XTP/dITP diphosphohydrolase